MKKYFIYGLILLLVFFVFFKKKKENIVATEYELPKLKTPISELLINLTPIIEK